MWIASRWIGALAGLLIAAVACGEAPATSSGAEPLAGTGGVAEPAGPQYFETEDGLVIYVPGAWSPATTADLLFNVQGYGTNAACVLHVVDNFGHTTAILQPPYLRCDSAQVARSGLMKTPEFQAAVGDFERLMVNNLGWKRKGYGAQNAWWNLHFVRDPVPGPARS